MKKFFLPLVVAFLSVVAVSCYQDERDASQRSQDSLQSIIDAKDGEISALFEMLNQIEDNLASISAKYSTVQELRHNNMESNATVKGEINEQLANIESMLSANKKKISELNAKISSMGKEKAELEAFLAKLEERITNQESQISELLTELEHSKGVIKELNQNVADLKSSNQEKDNTIARQIVEANKAYFIVGTYNDLKEAGVVSKTGGFIGIGKTQSTAVNMPLDSFTEIDRTKVTTISVNLKKALVVSKHPEGSYELVPDENDESIIAYLRILNPTLFWQHTRYLVVSTK